MEPIDRLLAVEEIRRVKSTYWHAIDSKDLGRLRGVFGPDTVYDVRGEFAYVTGTSMPDGTARESAAAGNPWVWIGADTIVAALAPILQEYRTMHLGGAAFIDVTGPDSATGRWAYKDYVDNGTTGFTGYGHYHDEYARIDGRWVISHTEVRRVRIDGDHPFAGLA